ncbi:MAG: hypothetical protein QOF48_1056 [Verrucomicrobiota bacterium]
MYRIVMRPGRGAGEFGFLIRWVRPLGGGLPAGYIHLSLRDTDLSLFLTEKV